MNTVTVTGDRLVVEPRGADKLWSLTRRLDVSLSHVAGATYDPGAGTMPRGVRAPGLRIPGKTAGAFVKDGERTFWNVTGTADTIVVQLHDERYVRLVLSVERPREVVDRINAAALTR